MHLVWYLGKQKRHDIETLAIDRVFNAEPFMQTSFRKLHQNTPKTSPRILQKFAK